MAGYRFSMETKLCYLSSDFGRDYACKVFALTPEALEQIVGRYVRGKRKGMLRGHITWSKTTRGGWVKTGAYDFDENRASGFVVRPGLTFGHMLFDGNGQQLKGPGSGVTVERMIQDELRRRGDLAPADRPVPSREPSPPFMNDDLSFTAPYLFIASEAIGSLLFECARHTAYDHLNQYGPAVERFVGA